MEIKNRAFSKIWIIGILAIVLVGGFLAWQRFGAQKTQDETADRKTYTNIFTNYQVKYPKHWQAADKTAKTQSPGYYMVFSDSSGEDKNNLIIFSGGATARGVEGWKKLTEENITIAGLDAKKYMFRPNLFSELEQTAVRNDLPQTTRKIIVDFERNAIQYGLDFNIFDGNLKLADEIISTFKFIEPEQGLGTPATCEDKPEGAPVITSLSSYSGLLGTKFEINGCNFSGFEEDKNAWIENGQGVRGFLRGEAGSTSKLLKITLNSPLCQKDTSYSGQICDVWLTITPGIYKIYTLPWGKKSNDVIFNVH